MNLRGTGISGVGVFAISLPRLEVLDLRDCHNLSEQGLLGFLSVCESTLCVLQLVGTNVLVDEITTSTLTFPKLKEICASRCDMLEGLLTKCHTSLKVLQMKAESMSGRELYQLKVSFPKLEYLNLDGSSFERRQLYHLLLVFGSNLRVLDLTSTDLSQTDASEYRVEMPKLECIKLNECANLPEDGLCKLLKGCKGSLNSLDLSGTTILGTVSLSWSFV